MRTSFSILGRWHVIVCPTQSVAGCRSGRRHTRLDGGVEYGEDYSARAGLVAALAYRPELLILDEPSSGLDPIVRRDILGAVLRTIAHEGRTVLFSSHLLDEVEAVADHVTMIDHGKIVLSAPLEEIKSTHRVQGRVPSLDEIFHRRVGAAAP